MPVLQTPAVYCVTLSHLLFSPWVRRRIAAHFYNLGAASCSFLCARVKPWGFRTKCILGKKWVGFCEPSRLGRERPSRGRSLISLYSWKPGEIMYTTESFCSAREVFLFFVLQCVQQISVTPGKKEIWVKEEGSSLRLVTSKLIETFNSGRDTTRPKWKRNQACRGSEQENQRSYHPHVKNYMGPGK